MQAESFYRRPLPPSLDPFASPEGRALFRDALAGGTMEGYFPLAEQFHTQAEPAFCGLGTLVIVLNALAIDPGRLWRGPWRWYSEELLDCCRPLEVVRREGITLDDFACLARCNGARAPVDPGTGRPRGYLLLERAGGSGGALCSVSCRERPFAEVLAKLREALPRALAAVEPRSAAEAVRLVLQHLPEEAAELVTLYTDALGGELEPRHRALMHALVRELRLLELYRIVAEAVEGPAREAPAVRRFRTQGPAVVERAALLLLVLPNEVWSPLPAALREPLAALRALEALPETLRPEVEQLRAQIHALERRCCDAAPA
jgi:hypothetical protein